MGSVSVNQKWPEKVNTQEHRDKDVLSNVMLDAFRVAAREES